MDNTSDTPVSNQASPSPEAPAAMPSQKSEGNPKLKLFIFLAVLGFFLAATVFALFSKKTAPKNLMPKNVTVTNMTVPVAIVETNLSTAVNASTSDTVAPERTAPTLVLSGILYSDDGASAALINGRVVPQGGLVDGARVEKIYPHRVELNFDNQTITLRSQ